MNAYLENALSLDEYRESKNKLMCQKQLLKEKLSAFEKKSHNRFELTENFLKANIHMVELANEKTNEENLHLFKKVGSNFQIKDQTVLFEPRGAWRIIAELGFFGGDTFVSALRADPISASKCDFNFWRCILELARTEFCPRRAQRGSEWAGGRNELRSREH